MRSCVLWSALTRRFGFSCGRGSSTTDVRDPITDLSHHMARTPSHLKTENPAKTICASTPGLKVARLALEMCWYL